MRALLNAATDVATFIFFDPHAIEPDDITMANTFDAINALTASGKAVCYSPASDGSDNFLILVDEEPDAEFVKRRQNHVSNMLLHIPSGHVVATGYEDMRGFSGGSYDPNGFEPFMGESTVIPPGDYAVDAFEIDWGEEVEWTIQERAVPGDEAFETVAMTSMGCMIAGTVLVLPAALGIIWSKYGFDTALQAAVYALAFHVIFWLIAIPTLRYSKRMGRMAALRKEIEALHPGVVLVFRPLTGLEKAGDFAVGKFGDGFA